MRSLLVFFGWFAVITSILVILVPYLRRKRDLLSTWTLFHLGCANFLGISAIQSGSGWSHMYSTPQDEDYLRFFVGGLVFYFFNILTYFAFSYPEKLASRTLVKWGPRNPTALLSLIPICILMIFGFLFVPNVQFIGQWMVFFGRSAGMIAVVFALVAWQQRPFNPWLPAVAGLLLLLAAAGANTELGRRDFLSLIITAPLAWYWLRARYYNPARTLSIVAVWVAVAMVLLMGVSVVRFAKKNPDLSVLAAAWERVKAIPAAFQNAGKADALFGGDTTEASLAAIQYYTRVAEPKPFFAVKYVLVHPVPRAWWPNKPEGLGVTLPEDIGWISNHGFVNLGPGIIGHGYHEGGLYMIAFYAILTAAIMRYLDGLLMRDPTNPYLIGGVAGVAGQLVAFVRGDIALFSVLILGGFITAMLLNLISRMLFGTERLPGVPLSADEFRVATSGENYSNGQLQHWQQSY